MTCDLSVPGQASPSPSNLQVRRFVAQQPSHQDPVWPRFPEASPFLAGSPSEPLKLKAPVSTLAPITKVERLTNHGFLAIPYLQSSLSSVFGVKAARFIGLHIIPPSPSDQLTMWLTDRIHQCASQTPAAMNNLAMLALIILWKAKQPDFSTADLDKFCTRADTS